MVGLSMSRYNTDPAYREQKKQDMREWAKNNRDKKNEYVRRRRAEKKQILVDRLGGECVGCGTTHNLQFDHIDRSTKSFNITKCIDKKWELVLAETDKCRLLCKSCHNIKTRCNNDNASTLKGYVLQSIENDDHTITVTYVKHTTNKQ